MPQCNLCDPKLGPLLLESDSWRLVLNHNQHLLGKCFLALRRHLELVAELAPAEWAELQQQIKRATQLLSRAFQPDHFNYAFLQNQDRHVHLHVIPRYAKPRTFAGTVFVDGDFPAHYAVPVTVRQLPPGQLSLLARHLREFAV